MSEVKAAEDSRTPKPRGRSGAQSVATASWSAAAPCRFHFSHPRALPVPWPHAALSRSCDSPHVGGYAQNQISKLLYSILKLKPNHVAFNGFRTYDAKTIFHFP